MHRNARRNLGASTLFVTALLAPQFALPQDSATDFVKYALPKGWIVERSEDAAIATPAPGAFDRLVSVQVCSRARSSQCSKTCGTAELRPNFFYFLEGQPLAVYSESVRSDGFRELRAQGPYGEPVSWVAGSVLCGSLGIVYVGATSTISLADAVAHRDEVVSSVRLEQAGSSSRK